MNCCMGIGCLREHEFGDPRVAIAELGYRRRVGLGDLHIPLFSIYSFAVTHEGPHDCNMFVLIHQKKKRQRVLWRYTNGGVPLLFLFTWWWLRHSQTWRDLGHWVQSACRFGR